MVNVFRIVAYLEGASFLILLFIAMPLKYIWHMPMAVRITGSAHGALFVLYCLLALGVWRERNWSLKTAGLALISSCLPAGPFIFDRKILSESDTDSGVE